MEKKQQSDVDVWLKRETPRTRKALESASRYFDANDRLTVNTLEAVYGRESSFGVLLRNRGSTGAAGHFHLEADTAKRYGLSVSKKNDQRFDVDRASSAAARYLKDLDTIFSKNTTLKGSRTIAVRNASERYKFILGAYNAGEGRIAKAQRFAQKDGRNPQMWADVQDFLEPAGASLSKVKETMQYVVTVPAYELEFARKSPAKDMKQKKKRSRKYSCTEGHWVTIDDRPVFICDRKSA